jgi:ABC-type nitrate/sulfonate/bicarbonate transport system permease component
MKKEIFIGPIIILIIWVFLTSFPLIKPIFLPAPWPVIKDFYNLFSSREILGDLGFTLFRWLTGLLIGILLGIPLGMLMGYSDKIYSSLEVIIDFFRSIPAMTLFPLFLIFFGIGDKSKIAISAWGSFLFILINAIYGVKHSRETRLMSAKALRANKLQTFTKFIFPDALPEIAAGIRISISLSLILVIASEMLMGTRLGLGKRIYEAGLIYNMTEMYATILLAGLLGYLSNKVFYIIETRLIHWGGK